MKKAIFSIIVVLMLSFASTANAYYDPQSVTNNRFGIHILEAQDIEDAAKLVNSQGGKWGYVTLVIREDQRDVGQWNRFFKTLNQNHLIPIVRIATVASDENWRKPVVSEAQNWADFLDSLLWPTRNRYVVLFNEPNHAKEWGGEINPKEYAQITQEYAKALKSKTKQFYVLNAGFDMASPQGIETADAIWYWSEMDIEIPGIFNSYDGWVSHSYPNPGFIQSPMSSGRTSIAGYRYEQDYLYNHFGVYKKPVFITETGWRVGPLTEKEVSDYYKTAFESIWTDNNLIAVTPFLLNYPQDVFSSFSWKNGDGSFRSQYGVVAGITKAQGEPELAPMTYFGKLRDMVIVKPQKLTSIPNLLF
ncbi:hypothetical protein HYT02_05615 [Candidatus Gottesmanbacteria bacterium]|nr:hypothetical protein [Candidatus Gottesmanbacteria bacterium]